MGSARPLSAALLLCSYPGSSLTISGIEVPHARETGLSRALPYRYPDTWPYSKADLTPEDQSADQLFYLLPKFVQHAGEECRQALTDFYDCVLPREGGQVLDLCSSWTSHYPKGYKAHRVVALGLNPLELLANPSMTEWLVQDLNSNPTLPFENSSFDVITNALSVDYITQPLELFAEMHRVLKPGGLCCMAFTNRCFPSKVVPAWADPFSDLSHVRLVGNYFHFSADWAGTECADVSPPGWLGQRDPMLVVLARKPGEA